MAHTGEEKQTLFHPDRDRYLKKVVTINLGQYQTPAQSVESEKGSVQQPIRYGFRSFDRQWIIPDHRLLSMARPDLWNVHSARQVFCTAVDDVRVTKGPALSFTSLLPDMHHYNGRGGRVYPLWADAAATKPNVKPALLEFLALPYGRAIKAEDVLAYIAAVMAHPAFTARFAADLVRPGLRLPITADAKLFDEAVKIGSEVIWLHCYGERFADPVAGRPKGAPRMAKDIAPRIPVKGVIPGAPTHLPETMTYDAKTQRLLIGGGYVENVTQAMMDYEISGKNVLTQWFSYRRRDRTKPVIGDKRPPSPLEKIQPEGWLAEYTSDLLDLLNVLGRVIALEPAQADLLKRICDGLLISAAELPVDAGERPA